MVKIKYAFRILIWLQNTVEVGGKFYIMGIRPAMLYSLECLDENVKMDE